MENPIKIMIVDDALLIRVIIRNILDNDESGRFKVVASAVNGEDAINKMKTEEIDLVIMDVEMPVLNGIEALKIIMKNNPVPVIMFSSLTKKGAKETIEALSIGAVDFITKDNDVEEDKNNLKKQLLEKIESAINSKPNKIIKEEKNKEQKEKVFKTVKGDKLSNLIAIGCSTGGPSALNKVLSNLPKDLNAGIVIVQHMPEGGYTASLAKHLNSDCYLEVKEAIEGEELTDGKIIIAPGGLNMELIKRGNKYQISLNKKESEINHKPSVDVLFNSISKIENRVNTIGVVLTGMGNDGIKGSGLLKNSGSKIITESEETAVIYGMPKQVFNKGYSDFKLPLNEIVEKLEELTKK